MGGPINPNEDYPDTSINQQWFARTNDHPEITYRSQIYHRAPDIKRTDPDGIMWPLWCRDLFGPTFLPCPWKSVEFLFHPFYWFYFPSNWPTHQRHGMFEFDGPTEFGNSRVQDWFWNGGRFEYVIESTFENPPVTTTPRPPFDPPDVIIHQVFINHRHFYPYSSNPVVADWISVMNLLTSVGSYTQTIGSGHTGEECLQEPWHLHTGQWAPQHGLAYKLHETETPE
jgi:hypothetical protein